jgi:hypothetical protein
MQNGLSNIQIENIMKNEAHFQGCFMRTENLPKTVVYSYILNLDEASDPGTHWVAVYHNEYYDSFG